MITVARKAPAKRRALARKARTSQGRRLANWHQVDPSTASAFGADEEGEVQA
jgi:hypothetical protein